MKKYKPWFLGKKCDLCKAPAIIFRCTRRKNFMLCDSRECDLRSRIQARLINILKIKEEKILIDIEFKNKEE
jgi:hypothetical protein